MCDIFSFGFFSIGLSFSRIIPSPVPTPLVRLSPHDYNTKVVSANAGKMWMQRKGQYDLKTKNETQGRQQKKIQVP